MMYKATLTCTCKKVLTINTSYETATCLYCGATIDMTPYACPQEEPEDDPRIRE